MMQTRRQGFVAAGLLVTGLLSAGVMTGCGGGQSTYTGSLVQPSPSPSPTPAPDLSRFVGTWSGPFTLITGQTGLTQVNITGTGEITGITVSSTDGSGQGPASGTIDAGGFVDVTFQYGSFSIRCTGNLTVSNAGDRLSGTLNRLSNGQPVGTVQVTLDRGQLQG